jgi:hypothetical protein
LSSNIITVIKSWKVRWERQVADMGEMRNAYKILVRIPEGKGPFCGSRNRWEDNIRMGLKNTQQESME